MSAAMRAFVGEIDQDGLRRFVPEELVRDDARGHSAQAQLARPITLVWALLDDQDAEAVRAGVHAGRHRDASGLLLNRAVEFISLGAAASGTTVRFR
jgi:hypothetical protein